MTMSTDLMTAQDAAERIGCTHQRVKQLVQEGRLAQPIRINARIHLHRRADIEVYRDVAAGREITLVASLLPDAEQPLRRTVDLLIDRPTGWPGSVTWQHVRVFSGHVGETERTVVVLSTLHASTNMLYNDIRDIAAQLNQTVLAGRGRDAVWIVYIQRTEHQRPRIENAVLRTAIPRTSTARNFLRRPTVSASTAWEPDDPSFHPLDSLHEVDRLIGAPLETFPGESYTIETVDRWQHARATGPSGPVPFLVDPYEFRLYADALHLLARKPNDRAQTARFGERALADLLRGRDAGFRHSRPQDRTWLAREIRDRARNLPLDLDEDHLAVAMTAVELTDADQAAIEAAGAPLTIAQLPTALTELRQWAEDTDEFADNPDPQLHDAISRAVDAVIFTLRAERIEAPMPSIPEPLVADVRGQVGQRFLDQISWEPAGARRGRRHRKLAASLIGGETARFGLDLDGNLIAQRPHRPETIAAEWPDHCDSELWHRATRIIADNEDKPGAIAVFLEAPDGLHLLPRGNTNRHNGWQFGYGGSSPGHLAASILANVTHHHGELHDDELEYDRRHALSRWLDLETERPTDHLRIDLAELRTRSDTEN
ncbi:helix-turn-helix transcriptional regulator [Nocardia salmonicida]|uniref:helix-turn-helix transcriptional regulator n=1 Tax=Nocardia salmonicida TaxID=53431 RepID=UPI0007A52774|nr:hypothetical protein [Nocardia salmonicida]MBC7299477.1 hypothetical protein [Nocardia sp.]